MPDYKLNKADGGPISKDKADQFMKRFRDKHPEKDAVIARFIGSDWLNVIIDQTDCVGVRVYFGYSDAGQLEIFFIGVRADGTNIGPVGGPVSKSGGDGFMSDSTYPCPPYCPS
jgi:hypothetical protein